MRSPKLRKYTRRHLVIRNADSYEVAVRNICATDHHQPATYHPWMGVTFCRCGRILWHGNKTPMHLERKATA